MNNQSWFEGEGGFAEAVENFMNSMKEGSQEGEGEEEEGSDNGPWELLKAAVMDAYPDDGSVEFDWDEAKSVVMGFLGEQQAPQEI